MKRITTICIALFAAVVLLTQCKPVDLTADYKDITVTYGILNIKDNVHYFKVYRGYITDGNLLCHEMKMHRNEYVTVAVRNYIREITSSTMRWDEGTGEYTLVKMSE